MAKISSQNIKVYPAVGRSEEFADSSYINTEANITGILKALYSKNNCSFVISDAFTAPFKFVIFGYYFELLKLDDLTSTNLWARIYISNSDIRQKLSNPVADKTSLDIDTVFNGIEFYNSDIAVTVDKDGMTEYDLQLTDESGNIPSLSKFYFNAEQIRNIDSGYLNEVFTTGSITASFGTFNDIYLVGKAKDYSICTTDNGKLNAVDLTVSDPKATAQNLNIMNNTCSFNYIDTSYQDSNGKINSTKKFITITYGSTTSRKYLEIK